MNTNETQKMEPDESGFLAALVVIALIIVPLLGSYFGKYGGGLGMFATAVAGVVAYLLLFGKRLRNRGQMRLFAALFAGSLALSAVITLSCWLLRSH